jgi:hypothetical protein
MPTKTAKLSRSKVRIAEPQFADDAFDIHLPEKIQSRLAGAGELPQLGSSIKLSGIQMAIRQSELGEPLFLFSLFRDMIENCSHLQAEMGKRVMSFMGKAEQIEPWDKNDAEDAQAKEVIEDMIDVCENWAEGTVHLANGHIWPIAGAEKIFAPVENWKDYDFRHPVSYRIRKIFPIPYALFTYRVAYQNVIAAVGNLPNQSGVPKSIVASYGTAPQQDVVGATALDVKNWPVKYDPSVTIWNPDDWKPDLRFYSTLNDGQINYDISASIRPDPIRHVLHSANVATASMRENFGSLLRSVLPWWFFQANLRDWWARGMERYGSPFAVAYANTANKNIFDLLTKAFNQASKVNALIVPPQAKIELKEVQVTSMADAYAKAIEVCDTQMTKAILGQTLSTTSKGSGMMGGSGVADLHGEVRAEWTEWDKRRFSEMEWKQIFRPYLRLNGYQGKVKVVRGGQSPANLSLLAKTYQAFAQAGVFPDPASEQDFTSMIGTKMVVKDIAQMKAAQNGKSADNKENYTGV